MVSSLRIFEEPELFLLLDVLEFRGIQNFFSSELIKDKYKKMMPMVKQFIIKLQAICRVFYTEYKG